MNKDLGFFGTLSAIIVAVLIVFVIMLLLAYPTMLLWNWLMTSIFGLRIITFWEAFGLNMLCGILFPYRNINSKN